MLTADGLALDELDGVRVGIRIRIGIRVRVGVRVGIRV